MLACAVILFIVGMGNIENLYAIIVKQEYHDYCFHSTFTENDCKHVNCF